MKNGVVFAPGVVLGGSIIANASAASPDECATLCQRFPGCEYFNHCDEMEEMPEEWGTSQLMHPLLCSLMAGDCSLEPDVQALGGPTTDTAGFLIRAQPLSVPGFATLASQAIEGSDFNCSGSILPGACGFASTLDALAVCSWYKDCRAVTVLSRGLDGCSSSVAVLKTTGLLPSSTYLSPTAFTLELLAEGPLAATYLQVGEAEVVAASDADMEAALSHGASKPNSTSVEWLGCIVARNSIMQGNVTQTLDGVRSAEECCRQCRAVPGGRCNVWNWCPADSQQECTYWDVNTDVALDPGQCELRYQPLVAPTYGFPPALAARGPAITFVAGSPLVSVGPQLPGFTRMLGVGLFAEKGFLCPDSIKPEIQECVLTGTASEFADFCQDDPSCAGFNYKPAGSFLTQASVGIFKHAANRSAMTFSPSVVLYTRDWSAATDGAAAPSGSSSGGGLSAGAIAGIACGAAVAAAAAAFAGWALLQRRRRQKRTGGEEAGAEAAGLVAGKGSPKLSRSTTPESGGSTQQAAEGAVLESVRVTDAGEVAEGGGAAGGGAAAGAAGGQELEASAAAPASAFAARRQSADSGRSLPLLPPASRAASGAAAAAGAWSAGASRQGSQAASRAGSGQQPPDSAPVRSVSCLTPPAVASSADGYLAALTASRSGSSGSGGSGGGQLDGFGGASRIGSAEAGPSAASGPSRTRSLVVGGATPVSPFAAAAAAAPAQRPAAERAASGRTGSERGASGRAASWREASIEEEIDEEEEQQQQQQAAGEGIVAAAKPDRQSAAIPELRELVAARDAMLESLSRTQTLPAAGMLLPQALPQALRDTVVPADEVTLLQWGSGHPQELGSGASGHVYRALYRNEVVAAKSIDLGKSPEAQRSFVTEASRMQLLRHRHVVSFIGVSLSGTKGLILMEYCDGRDLHSALHLQAAGSSQRVFGWYQRGGHVALDIARAVHYLHSKGICHMDIKSSNVLLTAGGTAKLADIGLSRLLTRTFLSDVPAVGTFNHMAPEVLLGGKQCTLAVDLYSFGVLLWEIITGEQPSRGRLRMPTVPDECPQEAQDLMMACLSSEPEDRPTAKQLLAALKSLLSAPPAAAS